MNLQLNFNDLVMTATFPNYFSFQWWSTTFFMTTLFEALFVYWFNCVYKCKKMHVHKLVHVFLTSMHSPQKTNLCTAAFMWLHSFQFQGQQWETIRYRLKHYSINLEVFLDWISKFIHMIFVLIFKSLRNLELHVT